MTCPVSKASCIEATEVCKMEIILTATHPHVNALLN